MPKNKTKLISHLLLCLSALVFMALSPGEKAPNFELKNQDGKMITLAQYQGKYVVVFFYPKDETPGCTKEACSFRDEYDKIKKENAVVLGVSRQDQESHQKFAAHHKLPFDLLADSDGSVAKAYSVGQYPVVGLLKRKSVLIGPDGKLLKYYEDVEPAAHAREVLADIAKAKSAK